MGLPMARTNYSFEKRQRELAKKKKREDKLQQRSEQRREKSQQDEPRTGEEGRPDADVSDHS
jgi:hypothetical protein